MGGKLPIDRAREARDAPKVYDEHRERSPATGPRSRELLRALAECEPSALPILSVYLDMNQQGGARAVARPSRSCVTA